MIANCSRQNNFQVLTAAEWGLICSEIKKDFGELTIGELQEVILNGAKGRYNESQFCVNMFTIYKWIENFLKNKQKAEIKEIFSKDIFGDV